MARQSLTPQNTRVAIYARVSTKDKGQEVENQLRQLREFSSSQGWAVYHEFVDHETGSTDHRTAFQAMFKDASQRKFDVLLFWALDRLSREGVLETLQHLNRPTSYGVGYIGASPNSISSPSSPPSPSRSASAFPNGCVLAQK